MDPIIITDNNFEDVVKSDIPVIIDFYADWCGPCKMQSPIIENIAKNNTNIKVGKINVDNNPTLAEKCEIMSIPTIIVLKDGEIIKKFIGLTSENEILESIK